MTSRGSSRTGGKWAINAPGRKTGARGLRTIGRVFCSAKYKGNHGVSEREGRGRQSERDSGREGKKDRENRDEREETGNQRERQGQTEEGEGWGRRMEAGGGGGA